MGWGFLSSLLPPPKTECPPRGHDSLIPLPLSLSPSCLGRPTSGGRARASTPSFDRPQTECPPRGHDSARASSTALTPPPPCLQWGRVGVRVIFLATAVAAH